MCGKWVKEIQEKEHPDILIGLFHAGPEGNRLDNAIENESAEVAKNVPGFDVIFMGHDHTRWNERVANVKGDSVLLIDPANTAKVLSEVTFTVQKQDGKVVSKQVEGKLVNMNAYAVDSDFMNTFQEQYETTLNLFRGNRTDRTYYFFEGCLLWSFCLYRPDSSVAAGYYRGRYFFLCPAVGLCGNPERRYLCERHVQLV